jgi:hypothetical protein
LYKQAKIAARKSREKRARELEKKLLQRQMEINAAEGGINFARRATMRRRASVRFSPSPI